MSEDILVLPFKSQICKRCNKVYKKNSRFGLYCERCKMKKGFKSLDILGGGI